MSPPILLSQRLSVPSRQLGPPAPTRDALHRMLEAVLRVPDHGGIAPWRVLAIEGEQRLALGEFLARRALELNPQAPQAAIDKDRLRFAHAPLVLTVVARLQQPSRIPEIEQILSAGCVCFALLQAAQELGFGAQWLTGWAAYDEKVMAHLGLGGNERIVGFIHVGTVREPARERPRPDPDAHFSVWNGECHASI